MTQPLQQSVPGDSVSMEKAAAIAKVHFWNQEANIPRAPAHWPRNYNIPVALRSPLWPDKGMFQRYGMDGIVIAFWWAFARAIEFKKHNAAQGEAMLQQFRRLCRNAVFDFRVFETGEQVF